MCHSTLKMWTGKLIHVPTNPGNMFTNTMIENTILTVDLTTVICHIFLF